MLNLAEAIVELRSDDVLREVERRAKEGDNPIDIINDCRDGMVVIGDRFASSEFFLAELVLADLQERSCPARSCSSVTSASRSASKVHLRARARTAGVAKSASTSRAAAPTILLGPCWPLQPP